MIFLNPWALLGLPVIGLLVWLHARRPRRTLQVSNLYLWQEADQIINKRRPVLERIRKNRLLFLRILFCLCMILALARPSWLFWNKSHTFVLVFDCSVSMNARERGGTRIEIARDKALKLLDNIGGHDRVLIVQAKPQPVLNSYAGSDKQGLHRALQALRAKEPSTNIAQALMAGIASIEKTEPYQAVVFSDGTQEISLPGKNEPVRFILIGESENNVAISRLSIRSNPFSPYDREIFTEAVNFSNYSKEFQFNMSLNGVSLMDETVKIGSMERRPFAIQAPISGIGIVKAEIRIKDDLDEDNSATATLDLKKSSVLLATAGNKFLENALRANPSIALTTMEPGEYSRSETKHYDVIILDGIAPANKRRANYLIIEPMTGNPLVMGGGLISPRPNHPVLAFVRLDNVIIDEAFPLKIQPSEIVLIEEQGKPLLAVSEYGSYRNARLGFDVRSSNMPLTASFPILMSNVVAWLGSGTDDRSYIFSERESNIKPRFKQANLNAFNTTPPVLRRTGREIWRLLLVLSIVLLLWIWSLELRFHK
jgi:Ca-activated chloride channel homolog